MGRYRVPGIGDPAGASLLPSKGTVAAGQAFARAALLQSHASVAPGARVPARLALQAASLATPVARVPSSAPSFGPVLAPSGPRAGGFTLVGGGPASSAPSSPAPAAEGGGLRDAGSSVLVTALPSGAGTSDAASSFELAPSAIVPALTQKLSVPTLPQDHNGPSSLEWAGIGLGVAALLVGAYVVLR